MKKRTKMKMGSKIMTGLLAGVLTFMFVKPKVATKKKEEISNNLNLKEDKNTKDNLFI